MKTIYECSQSKSVKWITAIFILAMVLGVLTEMYYVSKGMDVTGAIIVSATLIAVCLSCFLIFPMYIIADDEGIGIRTLLRTIRIPYENIDHIERVSEDKPLLGATNTIRLLGVGGVFGYIGWFRTKGIGTYRSYVTNAKKSFLIYRIKGMPIAISVNEPDEFIPYYLKGGAK
ncbi:PH domain-containing protein [Prevotella sp. E13-27]|uniref:PH domain-containing protein n=1 Tax=Prevotella sp. E13-27 TaxID=2938122 RepID=UPI00200AE02D|nr:PH domain-containing protein [Prevotella sp. E13-27]MCK8623340.1 PH domain-containing protein [Prevotella sp. E13-27]